MPDGSRPDDVFAQVQDGVITTWPTKLAMAPRLADVVEELLNDVEASGGGEAPGWPGPDLAALPWQEEERWN